MIKLKAGQGPTIRSPQNSDVEFEVSHDFVTVQTSGGTLLEDQVVDDAIYDVYESATYHREGSLLITGSAGVQITNLTPHIGSIGESLSITRLQSGVMNVLVNSALVTKRIELDLTDRTDEGDQPRVFKSTVSGSLAAHLQNQVDTRIDNTMTMGANGLVYTTQDHATPNYVRNPDLWCSDVDLTCISPWNSNGGNRKAGTLITKRHIVGSAHFEYNIGTTVRFVAEDNTVHDRTVAGKKRHPDYQPWSPDLTIYTLSSDLPLSITPCKVMPVNPSSYLVNLKDNRPPGLGLDQEEKVLIFDLNSIGPGPSSRFVAPVDSDRLLFHESIISGDSGNPSFLILNGSLVFVTVWTLGGSGGSGSSISSYIADLNQMIVDADTTAGVSTGYTVTEENFSAFPNYS